MKTTPILILHGWNLSGSKYEPLVKLLAKEGYTVHVLDFPGFGNTPEPKLPYTLDDYVAFVEDFLKKKKLQKVILFGHSFGGRVSIKFTRKHPEMVEKLILTGVPAVAHGTIKKRVFLAIAKTGNVLFALPLLSLIKEHARTILYKLAREKDYTKTSGVMRDTFKHIVNEPLQQHLPRITTPTLLIWGEEDRITPIGIAKKMKILMPNAQLVIVPVARHALPWAYAEKVANEVAAFLKGTK